MALQPQAIIEQVLNKIGHFRKILVGFSGGVDSTVLLHALYQIKKYQLPR